jgi:hypothetical protein
MSVNTSQADPESTRAVAKTADALIEELFRDLVQIHMAIAERTSDDKEVIPWTERELMGLIQKVGAFRREQKRMAAEASESARA